MNSIIKYLKELKAINLTSLKELIDKLDMVSGSNKGDTSLVNVVDTLISLGIFTKRSTLTEMQTVIREFKKALEVQPLSFKARLVNSLYRVLGVDDVVKLNYTSCCLITLNKRLNVASNEERHQLERLLALADNATAISVLRTFGYIPQNCSLDRIDISFFFSTFKSRLSIPLNTYEGISFASSKAPTAPTITDHLISPVLA